jgi:hypothetical protein
MSKESSSCGSKTPDTPTLEASYNSVTDLAKDVQSASLTLKTRMDTGFETITALLEKRSLSPASALLEITKPPHLEKARGFPPSQEPLAEEQRLISQDDATFLPGIPNGELADKSMPIAIVGMGCRFPQDATDPEKLWDMILRKQSACSQVPSDRFNVDAFYHPDSDRNGMVG